MNIAIVGASGFIGRCLRRDIAALMGAGCHVTATHYRHAIDDGCALDITSKDAIRQFLLVYRPDVIVWLAGSKDVEFLENNPAHSCLINEMPIDFILEAMRETSSPARLLYVSSDYVFDGSKGNYSSADACSPVTVYGRSKVYAEARLRAAGCVATILRTSAVMSAGGGFLGWLLGQFRRDGSLSLFTNTTFSPTPAVSLNKAVALIIQNQLWGQVLHFAGPAQTRYAFAVHVAGLIGEPSERVLPATADTEHSTFRSDLSIVSSAELCSVLPKDEDLIRELKRDD